jgi:hypothetical protein
MARAGEGEIGGNWASLFSAGAAARIRCMRNAATPAGIIPPPELVRLARSYADVSGIPSAARDFGVSRQSLAALLAGLRVRRGTIVLVARALRWPGLDSNPPPRAA